MSLQLVCGTVVDCIYPSLEVPAHPITPSSSPSLHHQLSPQSPASSLAFIAIIVHLKVLITEYSMGAGICDVKIIDVEHAG